MNKNYNVILNDSNLRDQICPGTQATHLAYSFFAVDDKKI